MQDLIKRYFWVLGALAVMACVCFAAKAVNLVIEAKYLNDSDHAPKITPVQGAAPTVVKVARSKDGAGLVSRDMFCSDCTPPAPIVVAGDSVTGVIQTSLPLVLLATNVSIDPTESYATIVNTESQQQGAYAVGMRIPGATGNLKEIHFKYVEFENSNHTERLSLAGASAPPPVVAQAEPQGSGDENQAMLDSGIKKIDDHNYEIDKSLVDKVLLNPMGFAKGGRIVVAMKDGKPNGFRVFGIHQPSVYAKLGFQNGDTLQSINNFELNSAQQALEAMAKLRDATSLQVSILRGGKPDQLNYSIK